VHSKSFFADRGPGSAGLYGFVTKKPLLAGRKRLHKAYQVASFAPVGAAARCYIFIYFLTIKKKISQRAAAPTGDVV
jgi:hypothetical protein